MRNFDTLISLGSVVGTPLMVPDFRAERPFVVAEYGEAFACDLEAALFADDVAAARRVQAAVAAGTDIAWNGGRVLYRVDGLDGEMSGPAVERESSGIVLAAIGCYEQRLLAAEFGAARAPRRGE
jgi:hypothetical protein